MNAKNQSAAKAPVKQNKTKSKALQQEQKKVSYPFSFLKVEADEHCYLKGYNQFLNSRKEKMQQ